MNEQERFVDLHIHTKYSDGSLSPTDVVKLAKEKNLAAIAITDHDNTDGIDEAVEEGKKTNIEIIPGIEMSAELDNPANEEIHILGYYISWKDSSFQESLKLLRRARQHRADEIWEKLGNLNVKLDKEHILASAGEGSIGRLHFARALIEEGYVKNTREAFDKYLSPGRPAYVPKLRLRPEEVIKMITKVGGISVLAHPEFGGSNRQVIKMLVNRGLKGIEVWHSKHRPEVTKELSDLSKELNILATGGSDCHGPINTQKPFMGKMNIPYTILSELKKYKNSIINEKPVF